MAVLGEAWIEVHADTGPFDRELQAAIDAALIKAEAAMRARGRDAGNAFSDGVERAVEDRVDGIGATLGDGLTAKLENSAGDIKKAFEGIFDGIGDGEFDFAIPDLTPGLERNRRSILAWARDTGTAAASAFSSAFSTIGQALSAVFGNLAAFSQSAAIPALLLGVGGLVGALIGLMPILMPIISLLASIPFILGGIGAAALVLVGIFSELADPIAKAFDARTPEKLAEAIEGLPPVVGRFVASFSILGKTMERIIGSTTLSFFGELTETFADLERSGLFRVIEQGANNLARALGDVLNELLKFAQTKEFRDFVDITMNSFAEIIRDTTPGIIAFFSIIARLTKSAAPFMERFFNGIDLALRRFDDYLARNPNGIADFFGDSLNILEDLLPSLVSLGGIIAAFVKAGSEPLAGGKKNFLQILADTLSQLSQYLNSKEGQEALVRLIELGAGLLVVLASVTVGLLEMNKLFSDFVEFLISAATGVGDFFRFITEMIIGLFAGLYQAVFDLVQRILTELWYDLARVPEDMRKFALAVLTTVTGLFTRLKDSVRNSINGAWASVASLKDKATNFFSNSGSWLYTAGKNLVTGLINGLKAAIPGLEDTLSWITSKIPDWKGPEDLDKKLLVPAGKDLMGGLAAGIALGARGVLGDLQALTGMIGATAYANTFNFAPGAIQQSFAGNATADQGRAMGNAAGGAIANTVNQQSMRAATRAI